MLSAVKYKHLEDENIACLFSLLVTVKDLCSTVFTIAEGVGLPSPVEVQKLRDQLSKEQDISATLLQELHDTRNQVKGNYLSYINRFSKCREFLWNSVLYCTVAFF